MIRIGLDSSVVLRLLVGEPEKQARIALDWLRESRKAGIQPVVCDLVAGEVYFALQYHYGVSKTDALAALSRFLSGGDVLADGAAAALLSQAALAHANPGFVDRLIHAHYTNGGNNGMVTFERAARTLSSVRLLTGGD